MQAKDEDHDERFLVQGPRWQEVVIKVPIVRFLNQMLLDLVSAEGNNHLWKENYIYISIYIKYIIHIYIYTAYTVAS